MHSASLYHLVEIIAVSMLVLGCAVYCALRLAPDAAIRRVRAALVGLPLPAALKLKLAAQQKKSAGCSAGCSGCASAAPGRSNQGLRQTSGIGAIAPTAASPRGRQTRTQ